MGILDPRIGLSAFTNDASEVRVCKYVNPGRGRFIFRGCYNNIFFAVLGKATETIKKLQILPGLYRTVYRRIKFRRAEIRYGRFNLSAPVDLFFEHPEAIADNYLGNGLK